MGIQTNSVSEELNDYKPESGRVKAIVAVCVGNFLEIFDFTVYSYFAVYISHVFFPQSSKHLAILGAVSVFASGFLVRPLGAIILGSYSDKYGAKAGLMLCMGLTGLGAIFMVVAPAPAVAGPLGVLMVMLARFVQGFSTGGEIGAGLTMLLDNSSQRTKDSVAAWQMAVQGISTIFSAAIAFLVVSFFSDTQIVAWAWRIPFIVSLAIIPVAFYIRSHTKDLVLPAKSSLAGGSMFASLRILTGKYTNLFLLTCGIGASTGAGIYIIWLYMRTYFEKVGGMDPQLIYGLSILSGVGNAILPIVIGKILDSFPASRNRMMLRRKALLFMLVIFLLGTIGTFSFPHSLHLFIPFYAVSTLSLGMLASLTLVLVGEAFPREIRASGVCLSYAFFMTLFGGAAQVIVTLLLNITDDNIYAPLIYLVPIILLSIWSALRIKKYLV